MHVVIKWLDEEGVQRCILERDSVGEAFEQIGHDTRLVGAFADEREAERVVLERDDPGEVLLRM